MQDSGRQHSRTHLGTHRTCEDLTFLYVRTELRQGLNIVVQEEGIFLLYKCR
jgi:hypothetical protein